MSFFKCPLDRKKVDRIFNWTIALGLIILIITLLSFAFLGTFSRSLADDYCFSELIKNKGALGGLVFFYNHISNRFGAFLLVAVSEIFGEISLRFLPGVMIFILVVSMAWNVYWLSRQIRLPFSWKVSFLFALLALFFVLFEAPNLFQSLYWRSGMVSYFAPMVFFFIISGILIWKRQLPEREKNPWLWGLLIAILSFLSGGMSETFAVFQTASWGLIILGWIIWKRKTVLNHFSILLFAALLGSILAIGVMVMAPGNQLRLDFLPQAANIWVVLQLSFQYALDFIINSLRGLPIPIFISFLTSALLTYHLSSNNIDLINNKKSWVLIIVIPVITYLLIASVCAPTVYGMVAYPEPRALMIARFIMTISTLLWGGLIGILSHRTMDKIVNICFASIIILGLLWIYPLRSAIQIWQQIPPAMSRAAEWDTRREEITHQINSGFSVVEIPRMDSVQGVSELTEDPQFWVNKCAASLYGVKLIRAVDKKP
jgi:hypothetical protein